MDHNLFINDKLGNSLKASAFIVAETFSQADAMKEAMTRAIAAMAEMARMTNCTPSKDLYLVSIQTLAEMSLQMALEEDIEGIDTILEMENHTDSQIAQKIFPNRKSA